LKTIVTIKNIKRNPRGTKNEKSGQEVKTS